MSGIREEYQSNALAGARSRAVLPGRRFAWLARFRRDAWILRGAGVTGLLLALPAIALLASGCGSDAPVTTERSGAPDGPQGIDWGGRDDDQTDTANGQTDVAANAGETACNQLDDDGDSSVDEGCPCPQLGAVRPCYAGPAETRGVGQCADGTQACTGSAEFPQWGTCVDSALPSREVCGDGLDQDCNGVADDDPSCPSEESCDANSYPACIGGNLYWHDSCGAPGALFEQCERGCQDGQCLAAPTCEAEATSRCSAGDLYWYDSCGSRGARKQSCVHGCADGACKPAPQPTTCGSLAAGWLKGCGGPHRVGDYKWKAIALPNTADSLESRLNRALAECEAYCEATYADVQCCDAYLNGGHVGCTAVRGTEWEWEAYDGTREYAWGTRCN
jgi:hypothetical protein